MLFLHLILISSPGDSDTKIANDARSHLPYIMLPKKLAYYPRNTKPVTANQFFPYIIVYQLHWHFLVIPVLIHIKYIISWNDHVFHIFYLCISILGPNFKSLQLLPRRVLFSLPNVSIYMDLCSVEKSLHAFFVTGLLSSNKGALDPTVNWQLIIPMSLPALNTEEVSRFTFYRARWNNPSAKYILLTNWSHRNMIISWKAMNSKK